MEELLRSLQAADHGVRTAAERRVAATPRPEFALELVGALATGSLAVELRTLASILLRKCLVDGEDYGYLSLSEEARGGICQQILALILSEPDIKVRSLLVDVVGKLAVVVLEDQASWPEILPFTQQLVSSPRAEDRCSGLNLLEWLFQSPSYLESLSSAVALPFVINTLKAGLVDRQSLGGGGGGIALAAIRTLCRLVESLRLESELDQLKIISSDVIGGLSNLVEENIALSSSSHQTEYVSWMIHLASERPAFYTGANLMNCLSVVTGWIQSSSLSSSAALRNLLIEFVVTLCESAPRDVRRLKVVPPHFLPVLVSIMTAVPHEAGSFGNSTVQTQGQGRAIDDDDEDDDEEEISNMRVAAEAYDRICVALGFKCTFPHVSAQIKSLVAAVGDASSSLWQGRHAAATILGNYVDSISTVKDKAQVAAQVNESATIFVQFTADPVPRVRQAAFVGITALLVVLGNRLSEELCGTLLEVIVQGVGVSSNPAARVRVEALSCLINILSLLPLRLLQQASGVVMQQTVEALSAGPLKVQERSVSVIIALAVVIKNEMQFAQFYDSIIPVLKQLLTYAQGGGMASLWGHALECYAIVGHASGKEKFRDDALDMMQALMNMQQQNSVPEAYQSEAQSFVLKVWVRMAQCLGTEFVPFLPLVIAKLLPVLEMDITDGTDDVDLDDPNLETRSDIDIILTQDGGYTIVRSSAVEEQASACELIRILMNTTQDHFSPFAEPVAKAVLPLLQSPHEDVRRFSLAAIPELVCVIAKTVAVAAGGPSREALSSFLGYSLAQVVKMMQSEEDLEIIMTALQVLRRSIQHAATDWGHRDLYEVKRDEDNGEDILTLTPDLCLPLLQSDQLRNVCSAGKTALRDSLQRRAVFRAEAQVHGKDEEDEQDEQDFMEFSGELHYNVCDLVGALLCTHRAIFFPIYVEEWHPFVCELIHPYCLPEDRSIACSLLADVFQYLADGPSSVTQLAELCNAGIMEPLLDCCANGQTPALRRLSAFALGTAARRFPHFFAPYVPSAVTALGSCVSRGDEDGAARGCATDNAAAAVGAILLHFGGTDGGGGILSREMLDVLWRQWLGYLPLAHDEEENLVVNRQLCLMLRERHDGLCGSPERICIVINVLVRALVPSLTQPLADEIRATLKNIPTLFEQGVEFETLLEPQNAAALARAQLQG